MCHIKVQELSYSYPDEKLKNISDINLTINEGEILFLCGSSGSGKSTLSKCITGAIPNFYGGTIGGRIFIDGKDINELSDKERAAEVTMVFQDPERQMLMDKVFREIAFGLENIGLESSLIKRRTAETMQFCNVLHLKDRLIGTLSGGEKQRIAVASALAYMPKCIIFDEPTSQLDPSSSDEIINLIRKINEELGITVIIVEQRVDRCFDISDKIGVMEKGKLIFLGSKRDMYRSSLEEVNKFLPTYLKVAKTLNIKEMPRDVKMLRQEIKGAEKFNKNKNTEEKSSESIIEINKLTCKYDRSTVIDDISLSMKKGSFNAIIGSNGAGKTTLIKAIMGFMKYEGSVKLKGKEIKKTRFKEFGVRIGYVAQNPNDYLSKDTVYDELKFTLDNYGLPDDGIIDETLTLLGINKFKLRNPRDLSGGEKQRAAIASVLVLKPEILILDEPTRGLDLEVKNSLGKVLNALKESGSTIIMITHDMDFAAEFCNNFILMFSGRIIASGSREKILGDGIYYTTSINKLFRGKGLRVFTLNDLNKINRETL